MTGLRRHAPALLACLLLAGGAGAEGETCDVRPPARGPVSLILLQSGRSVHELAASVGRGARVLAKDSETVVFDDGRVITADAEGASAHLNRLGWGGRSIQVVASFPAAPAQPRRDRG
jgi:hypothetical protein